LDSWEEPLKLGTNTFFVFNFKPKPAVENLSLFLKDYLVEKIRINQNILYVLKTPLIKNISAKFVFDGRMSFVKIFKIYDKNPKDLEQF
jgi:hypothetical protein